MSTEIVTQLEHDATKRMFERLVAARDKSKQENETIIKDLEGSHMFQDAFCCDDSAYREQITTIVATMPKITKDYTVGEYLYGCFQPETIVEIACTPACADGGLRNPDLNPCQSASYEKRVILKKLNSLTTSDAHLFIAANNSITADDIHRLRADGVKSIITYTQDGNSINYIRGTTINIPEINTNSTATAQATDTSSTNWAWLWVLIVVILIIVIVVLFLSR